jgi:single-strand DNA-binding protein
MARDLNISIIIGNLTRDPELKYAADGKAICKISIANNQDFGEKKHVNFFDCTCFGKLAEVCVKYLKKGSKVCVKGQLRQESWEKDGVKHYKTGITIDEVEFLNSNSQATTEPNNADNTTESQGAYVPNEDIPF